jgi:hypothetical protein
LQQLSVGKLKPIKGVQLKGSEGFKLNPSDPFNWL